MARLCDWCRQPLRDDALPRARYCNRRCRQAHWRARAVSLMEGSDGRPRRIGYADPPYPELAHYYADQPNYGGEVDHAALIPLLTRYDGWALSTSSKALRTLLPLCPPEARVAAWVKPIGVPKATRGPHSRWEAVIYVPARHLQPGKPDWLRAMPARGGESDLIGRKSRVFYLWLFELLGMAPGDGFADLYPGSQMGSRCWRAIEQGGSRRVLDDDASPPAPGDAAPSTFTRFGSYLSFTMPPSPRLLRAREQVTVMLRQPGMAPLPPGVIGVSQDDFDAILQGKPPAWLVKRVCDDTSSPLQEDDDGL